MTIHDSILALIGHTPLLRLRQRDGEGATILGKCEFLNPSGSVKDRAALAMLETAEKQGLIQEDTVIIEPTSGNTGVALAMISAVKGWRCVLTMPDSMSMERRALLKAYGAELELTPAHLGMQGAIDRAQELAANEDKAFIPQQFQNKANPMAHVASTAVELWEATEGQIDVLVVAVGTGGTFSGIAQYLKDKNPKIHCVVVEPHDSAVISGQAPGPHMIQGIGAGFVPDNLNIDLIDEVLMVENHVAIAESKRLAKEEGVFCGISSGANVAISRQIARDPQYHAQTIVTVLCDVGERYLSLDA